MGKLFEEGFCEPCWRKGKECDCASETNIQATSAEEIEEMNQTEHQRKDLPEARDEEMVRHLSDDYKPKKTLMAGHNFLEEHELMRQQQSVDHNHVIVDREDWRQAVTFINNCFAKGIDFETMTSNFK